MSAKSGPRLTISRHLWHWRSRLIRLFFSFTALAIALTLGIPLIYMIVSSFKPDAEMYIIPPALFPKRWSLEGYRGLLLQTEIPKAFRNSFGVSTISSSFAIILSVGLCYSLTRFRIPGMKVFTYLTLFVYTLPSILLVIPIYSLWSRLGVTGGLLPLSLTYTAITLPFAVWILRSYFAGIPLDLEEAALVDGATRAHAFLHIILPLARPGIIATFIFTFILSWNEVLYATIFATSADTIVMSSALATMLGGSSGWISWSIMNAAGTVATVPVLIFFLFIQRQLVTGLTAGAVKG